MLKYLIVLSHSLTCLCFSFLSYPSHHSTAGTLMKCTTTSSTSRWRCVLVHPAQPGLSSRACWRKMAHTDWDPGMTLWVGLFNTLALTRCRHYMYSRISCFWAPSGGRNVYIMSLLLINYRCTFTFNFFQPTFYKYKVIFSLLFILHFQNEIKAHGFFSSINWDDLEQKKIPPPFTPNVVNICFLLNNQNLLTVLQWLDFLDDCTPCLKKHIVSHCFWRSHI